MERFVVRKNTLPYVHQWAVIDTETGNKVGDYKTLILANKAYDGFMQHGLPDNPNYTPPGFEDAWNAVDKRMVRPDGDPQPKPKKNPKHSHKRPVELN